MTETTIEIVLVAIGIFSGVVVYCLARRGQSDLWERMIAGLRQAVWQANQRSTLYSPKCTGAERGVIAAGWGRNTPNRPVKSSASLKFTRPWRSRLHESGNPW